MYLTRRRIRSAGRTSGSIEITLPTELGALREVECRLSVRDGPRPEIILQPDLSAPQALFETLWQKLGLGLGEIGEIEDFSPADFTLALFPAPYWQERPPLAYADALAVLSQGTSEALARLVCSLAVVAGRRLGLNGTLALAFGDAMAYLLTGAYSGLGTDFERGMAHRIFWGEGYPAEPLSSPLNGWRLEEARPGLRRVYEQFRTWQEDSESYTSARENWYRALKVELVDSGHNIKEAGRWQWQREA